MKGEPLHVKGGGEDAPPPQNNAKADSPGCWGQTVTVGEMEGVEGQIQYLEVSRKNETCNVDVL